MDPEFEFLELSLPATDVQASLDWYVRLGFSQLPVGEIRSHHYAVVSDGRFCLGLHGRGIDGISLSFVRPELARYVRRAQSLGRQFDFARLDSDQFHEAGLQDPDGTGALLLEARTFSPCPQSETEVPLVGLLEQLQLPCSRLGATRDFWQDFGFIVVQSERDDHAQLHAPGLVLEFQEGTRQAVMKFVSGDLPILRGQLEQAGFDVRPAPGGVWLQAPEGTRLLISEC